MTVEAKSWWRRLLPFSPRAQRGDPEVAFPPGFLATLDRLRILALKAAGGGLKAGHRLGAYKGGQLEFHDYRAYAPGDDLRYLDWNLYARLGKPFIKEFAREEAGVLHLLVDGTASMGLGTPSPWTFARRLAALFAHVGWSAHDSVKVYVFRGPAAPLESYPPRGSRGNTAELLDWLARQRLAPAHWEQPDNAALNGAAPRDGTLSNATRAFLREKPALGRVFLISDFWAEERDAVQAVQLLAAASYEPAAVHAVAPADVLAPEPGPLRVLTPEEGGEVELEATSSAAERYLQEFDAHRASIEATFRRHGGWYLFERSDTSLERVLILTLRKKRWVG